MQRFVILMNFLIDKDKLSLLKKIFDLLPYLNKI